MRFDAPWFLTLLPALLWWGWSHRVVASAAIRFPARRAAIAARPSWRRRLSWLPRGMAMAAGVLLIVALARPQAGVVEVPARRQGIDIELVVDVSSSMRQSDLAADRNRLEVVKRVVDDFVAGRDGDRIGLLTFAGYTRVVSPLTHDHDVLREFLGDVRPVVPGSWDDGTSIGLAIADAVFRLRDSGATSRVVVLLTDGRETRTSIDQREAADLARAHGVKVYTVAAGRRVGRWATELGVLAEATGGRGFVARDADVLATIYAEIDELETHEVEVPEMVTWSDRYPPLVAAALLLLCLVAPVDRLVLRRAP